MFSTLWDWSCFVDLVHQFVDLDQSGEAEFSTIAFDIRWCGLQILSAVLKVSDKAAANYDIGDKEAFACLLRLVHVTYG